MQRRWALALPALALVLSCQVQAQSDRGFPAATVDDAIGMTRIQYLPTEAVAAISPDGRKAATVTWRGDLERNVNVYTLMVFDIGSMSPTRPVEILSRDFTGDPLDQLATPVSQLVFLGDNRTLAFLGRTDDGPAQVFTVDTVTRESRQLTHHATDVRSFVVGSDGQLRAFSAVASATVEGGLFRSNEEGIVVTDRALFPFPFQSSFPFVSERYGRRLIREYLVSGSEGARKIFDSTQSRPALAFDLGDPEVANSLTLSLEDEGALSGWATLTANPQGTHALLFPYGLTEHPMQPERYAYYRQPRMNAYARRVAAPYGLVDLKTGRIERLIDAPHPQFERHESAAPLWSSDGRSVILYTLLPDRPADPPQWVEVDIATREVTLLQLPKDWRPIAWAAAGRALVLSGKGGRFASLSREAGCRWGKLVETGSVRGFNSFWEVATNGRVAIGVKDSPTTSPELALYDLASASTKVLSDLNPQLRQRSYGVVATLRWENQYDDAATGFLIKPLGYKFGTRYPLVILLDDGLLGREGEPFLLDAAWQLSGHAVQMLAAEGFMVLYPREPTLRGIVGTPEEGVRVRAHVESAIAKLDREGLIDPNRVGISGWSRAGYHTDYLLIHSSVAFAAATAIDGGSAEYNEGMRPFTDEELQRIRTPKLFQAHGRSALVSMGSMADRMTAWNKPAEILYFPTASHSTTRPRHRARSLGMHIDWWRFWLKGEEDPNPVKVPQYTRWRKLRALQQSGQ